MKNLFKILCLFILVSCNDKSTSENQNTASNKNIAAKKETAKAETKELQNETDSIAEKQSEEVVHQPIDFEYQDINGNTVKLSDYRGKIVVVNFWATWCAPCRKEMPDFVKFKDQYQDQVEILGIDFEDTDIETVKAFTKDFEINYPILITDVYNPTEFEKENSMGLPTTVFFDQKGVQFDKRIGPVHYADLVEITKLEPKNTNP